MKKVVVEPTKFEQDLEKDYDHLFDSLGDFCREVRIAETVGGPKLHRLSFSVSKASNTEVGADGGFAVPTVFAREIVSAVKCASLMGLCDIAETPGKKNATVTDGDAPWDADNGIQIFWEAEGEQRTESIPALETRTQNLHKLTALIPVSVDLLEDAPSLDTYLRRKVREKFASKLNAAIVNGTGVGMPLGILNSYCLVTAADLLGMHARWHSEPRNGAWLTSKAAEGELISAAISAGVYASSNHTIFGLPIMPCQACSATGTGRVVLADLSQYSLVVRTTGMRVVVSMHLWFDHDIAVFKFTLPITGQPWWSAPVAQADSSDTLSPFVALAA